MIRIGLIGTDSHHSVYLPQEVNLPYSAHYDSARFTKIWGEDREVTASKAQQFAIAEVVDSPQDALRDVDAVMVLNRYGDAHYKYGKLALEAGIPVFIDKPLANSLREACELVALAKAGGVPLMSCSHFKFDPAFVDLPIQRSLRAGFVGGPRTGPFPEAGSSNPFYYAIHPVEIFHALMGPGIAELETLRTDELDNVTVRLLDGRRGMIALLNDKQYQWRAQVVGERVWASLEFRVQPANYRGLMHHFLRMVRSRSEVIPTAWILETIATVEAIELSAKRGGQAVTLRDVWPSEHSELFPQSDAT
jgi:predicted dehydrogenase